MRFNVDLNFIAPYIGVIGTTRISATLVQLVLALATCILCSLVYALRRKDCR